MAVSLIFRLVAIFLTTAGGAFGAIATHKQIQEGNERRLEADKQYREQHEVKELSKKVEKES